jgi:hypothetical protein
VRPDDYSRLTSLIQVRHAVSEYIPFAAARARLSALYTGLRIDEWFLVELLDSFPVLLDYRGGIAFIGRINEKMTDRCSAWDRAILASFAQLLKYDLGFDLVRKFVTANSTEPSVIEKVHALLTAFASRSDGPARELVLALIQIYKENSQVLAPLVHHEWHRAPDCSFLCALIEVAPCRVWRPGISAFLEDPRAFCGNPITNSVLCAVLRRGGAKEQDSVIEPLLPTFPALAMRHPDCKIAQEMLNVATVRQKLQMAAALQGKFAAVGKAPPFVEDTVIHLLWALPARARAVFIDNARQGLLAMESPRVEAAMAQMATLDAVL